MVKKILLNTDSETASFNQFTNSWLSRHGKAFEEEVTARLDGCTHIICQTCSAIINKNSHGTGLVCKGCSNVDLAQY